MLARAPGDVAHANRRTSNRSPPAAGFTPPGLGQRGSVPSYAGSERARRAAHRGHISQRRAVTARGSGDSPRPAGATGQCAQLRRERTRTACRAPRSHQPTARRHGPRAVALNSRTSVGRSTPPPISGMARAHRAAWTAASLRQGASASSYRHQRDRIVLRGIACHPAQPAAAHKAVLRPGSHHRSATLGDRRRLPARLGGQFVPGGQARGASCGQHSESPRPATAKGGRALGDGPGGSARSRPR